MAERIRLSSTRFENGNRAAVGNRGPEAKSAIRRGRAALAHIMNSVADKETGETNWWKLWMVLLGRAFTGDAKSARLILAYALGEPRQVVDVTNREPFGQIPLMHDGMTLAQMSAIYHRTLQADCRRFDDDGIEIIPPPALKTAEELKAAAAAYRQSCRELNFQLGREQDP
jgi:hypothetical protein